VKTTNLFLIASPFQLLNAIEAKSHFSESAATLVMLHSADTQNNDQMMQILDLAPWNEVIIVKSRNPIVTYLKAMSLLSRLRRSRVRFEKIFIGEFKSHTFHTFCQNLDAQQFFNLDDGVSTIELQRQVFVKPAYRLEKDKGLKHLLKYLIKSLFSLNGNEEKNLKFDLYTCFDLIEHAGQTIVVNEYRYLSQKIAKLNKLKTKVYFYGSCISEKNIMGLESEITMLGKVKTHFSDRERELLYIPHRLDSPSKLSAIRELGIRIKLLGHAAEIEPLLSGELPGEISSFFSTALYTLSKIHQYESVVSFRIPVHLLVNRREAISKLYEEYARHMTIIDL
jgi:hypothetical protein